MDGSICSTDKTDISLHMKYRDPGLTMTFENKVCIIPILDTDKSNKSETNEQIVSWLTDIINNNG